MATKTMNAIDPASWDPSLDALVAAPGNHKLLYEDDNIRVISVSIRPGEKEPVHHHRYPSVFVIDRMIKARDFDADGNEIPLPVPEKFEPPLVVNMPPQPPHSVLNIDNHAFHGTRIEFKRGYAGDA